MGSKIEWLNRPGTTAELWNPVKGCSPVSPGCRNCWARKYAERLEAMVPDAYEGTTVNGRFCGGVWCCGEVLDKPLHWRKPRTVGVCLMGDLFHKAVPRAFLVEVHTRIWLKWQSTFVVLTKRASRMRRLYQSDEFWEAVDCRAAEIGGDMYRTRGLPLANLWAMVSVEDQKRWDQRVPDLINTPAAIRGVSVEPILEPITMHGLCGGNLHWIIVAAESLGGRAGRQCKDNWVAGVRMLARQTGVPLFVKQLYLNGRISKKPEEWPVSLRVREWPSPWKDKQR
jgi:protein gp37